MLYKKIILLFVMICFTTSSFAHYIWIETASTSDIGSQHVVKIYYGEFNEGQIEVSGGRLEEVEGIKSWVIAPNGQRIELEVVKLEKYYQVTFVPKLKGNYTLIAVNKVRGIKDWSKYGIGVVKPTYYASQQISVGSPNLLNKDVSIYPELAIVPIDSSNTSFVVLFENKPFAVTKLFVHAPNEWSKEYKTDENGVFSFKPLWNGRYVIECIFKEEKQGVFKGGRYEAIRHRVTYSLEIKK